MSESSTKQRKLSTHLDDNRPRRPDLSPLRERLVVGPIHDTRIEWVHRDISNTSSASESMSTGSEKGVGWRRWFSGNVIGREAGIARRVHWAVCGVHRGRRGRIGAGALGRGSRGGSVEAGRCGGGGRERSGVGAVVVDAHGLVGRGGTSRETIRETVREVRLLRVARTAASVADHVATIQWFDVRQSRDKREAGRQRELSKEAQRRDVSRSKNRNEHTEAQPRILFSKAREKSRKKIGKGAAHLPSL